MQGKIGVENAAILNNK